MPNFLRIATLVTLAFVGVLASCTSNDFALENALPVPQAKGAPGLKYGDAKPVPISGRQPETFAVHGVDLSRWNIVESWSRAKQAGIAFAFIKATDGKDDRDPKFAEHWNAAKSVRMPRGAYHFYYFCAGPLQQAANFIRTVPRYQGALPPVLDVEWNHTSPTCVKRPPADKVLAALERYLQAVKRHYGQTPIIYTTVGFYRDVFKSAKGHAFLKKYPLWLRSVRAEPKYIYPGLDFTIWQYTGSGLVPGFRGKVDINAFNGTGDQWRNWVKTRSR